MKRKCLQKNMQNDDLSSEEIKEELQEDLLRK